MSTEARADEGRQEDRPRRPGDDTGDDTRELVARLRAAPAEEVLADLVSTLLSTAQVKLGRRDARLFIDLCGLTIDYAGPYLSDEIVRQVQGALGQLRLGQVTAENDLAEKVEPEPNDLSRIPTAPTPGSPAAATSDHQPAPASSKLWVPGR